MTGGFVKIHRSVMKWEWKDEPLMFAMWVGVLFMANYEEKKWRGVTIKRGQFISTPAKIAAECGLTEKQVRTRIDKLVLTGEIIKKGASNFTLYTIVNYNKYQDKPATKGEQKADEGRTEGGQRATTKELKNLRTSDDNSAGVDLIHEIGDWCNDHLAEHLSFPLPEAPIHAWLEWGADFEKDIKPAVMAWHAKHKGRGKRCNSLTWFNESIGNSITQRKTPQPTGGSNAKANDRSGNARSTGSHSGLSGERDYTKTTSSLPILN